MATHARSLLQVTHPQHVNASGRQSMIVDEGNPTSGHAASKGSSALKLPRTTLDIKEDLFRFKGVRLKVLGRQGAIVGKLSPFASPAWRVRNAKVIG